MTVVPKCPRVPWQRHTTQGRSCQLSITRTAAPFTPPLRCQDDFDLLPPTTVTTAFTRYALPDPCANFTSISEIYQVTLNGITEDNKKCSGPAQSLDSLVAEPGATMQSAKFIKFIWKASYFVNFLSGVGRQKKVRVVTIIKISCLY